MTVTSTESPRLRIYGHAAFAACSVPPTTRLAHEATLNAAQAAPATTDQIDWEPIRTLIVRSVDSTIRALFPTKYFGLCHIYAIVGANVASLVLGREYRPVAGLAVIDAGGGCFIRLTDNQAFARLQGGSYHCWIEAGSKHDADRELIDITFMHNRTYAQKNKMFWRRQESSYLWGRFRDLVLDAELDALPAQFPEGRLWLRETPEGLDWMDRQIGAHVNEYARITHVALKMLVGAKELRFTQQRVP